MHNNLKKDYVWNTIGVFAQNAISPLLLIVITRINGVYDSGIFSFAFSVAIIFWALGMWGGRTYQVSDVQQEFAHRSYIVARLILAGVMLVGGVLFATVNHYSVLKEGIIVGLVLFKALESIADGLYGIMQVHGYLYISGKSLLYKAISGLGGFLVVDLLTHNILLASVSIVLLNLLIILIYDLPHTKRLEDLYIGFSQISQYAREATAIVKRSAPVFGVLFLSMFSLNIPRYFIDRYHPEQLGYFGIMAMPITLIALLMSFIVQPKIVYLAELHGGRNYRDLSYAVRKLLFATCLIGLSIVAATYLLGIPVLELIFGITFAGYKLSLLILVTGGVVNALISVLLNILIIMRSFKLPFYILLLTNVLLVVISVGVVRRFGLLGGVILFSSVNLLQGALLISGYARVVQGIKNAKEN